MSAIDGRRPGIVGSHDPERIHNDCAKLPAATDGANAERRHRPTTVRVNPNCHFRDHQSVEVISEFVLIGQFKSALKIKYVIYILILAIARIEDLPGCIREARFLNRRGIDIYAWPDKLLNGIGCATLP